MRDAVAEDLTKNGLELEAASLTQLDQTGMEFFNPSNAFDAEGLTRLTEQIEHRKKQRNDVEQDTLIAIRNKNLEAEKLLAEHRPRGRARAPGAAARGGDRARPPARRGGRPSARSASRTPSARRSPPSRAIDPARIRSEQTLEQERIGKERAIQGAEIERRLALELAEQQRAISVARESKAQSEAQAAAESARALAVSAEEKVFTAREVEMAERKKAIDLIGAQQVAEREALRLTSRGAGREATPAPPAAPRCARRPRPTPTPTRSSSMAMRVRAEIEAEAARMMNEAHNMLSPEARMPRRCA